MSRINHGRQLLVILICLINTSTGYSDISINPPSDGTQPVLPDFTILLMPVASQAYSRECIDNSPSHVGNILFNDTNKIDIYRCIRWLNGDLKLRADDNRFHQVGLPYLYSISGDLRVEAKAVLDEFYLPRLTTVGGNIVLDYNNMFEYLDVPSLKKANNLVVLFRTNDLNLDGLNSITQLKKLELVNNANDPDLTLNGLQGLVALNTLNIFGGGVGNPDANMLASDRGFLESLTKVEGDVKIDTTGMNRIYALGNINHITGNLVIADDIENPDDPGTLTSLLGMEKLTQIDGALSIRNIESLTSLTGFNQLIVSSLTLENNPNINDLSGLINGNSLKLSVAANGSVNINNNNKINCSEISAYTNLLDSTVNINTPGCP